MKNNNLNQSAKNLEKSNFDFLKSSKQLQSSSSNQVASMKVLAEEIRIGTASLFQRINAELDDLEFDPSEQLVISDQYGYERSKSGHENFARLLNTTMSEFSQLTGEEITEADRDMFLCFDEKQIKQTYLDRVRLKCRDIFPESIRQEHEKAYLKSTLQFFSTFLISKFEPASRIQNVPHFDRRRIRFVDGKAVFNEEDAHLLLREKFCVDFGDPNIKALLGQFQRLSRQYDRFRKFLEENSSVYGIEPSTEPLIGQYGALIELDPTKSLKMKLNRFRLSAIPTKIKG